jgi:hypothetical protein
LIRAGFLRLLAVTLGQPGNQGYPRKKASIV